MCTTCIHALVFPCHIFYRDTGKKKKLFCDDDDFEPLKPVNTTPLRLQKKKPESIDKMLTKKDLTYLEKEGNCLQDIHIAMAGALLKKQFPEKAGLQPTVYNSERLQPQSEGTIQIHFDRQRKHWTSSTFSGGMVRYYDSLYPGDLSEDIRNQLRSLYGHLMKTPKVMVVRVQQQQGTVDCGLFAIAYAVSVANGKDPAKVKFEQPSMRTFFAECIKKRHLDVFPHKKEIVRVARPDTIML